MEILHPFTAQHAHHINGLACTYQLASHWIVF
ncbi:Uncharacterised protein [Vibrio cholerae]|nr:Uncharacterised protein [Vibrio cholerae]